VAPCANCAYDSSTGFTAPTGPIGNADLGSIPAVEVRSSPSEPPRPPSDLLAPFDDHGLRAVHPIADARPVCCPRQRRRPRAPGRTRLRSHGSCTRATTLRRPQAPNGAAIWKRTSPRNPSRSAKRKCRRSRLAYWRTEQSEFASRGRLPMTLSLPAGSQDPADFRFDHNWRGQ
jgi:hypothetical protein